MGCLVKIDVRKAAGKAKVTVCHKTGDTEQTEVAMLLCNISLLIGYPSFKKKKQAAQSLRAHDISLSTLQIKLVLFYHAQICLDLSSDHSSCCQYLLMIITSNTILTQR